MAPEAPNTAHLRSTSTPIDVVTAHPAAQSTAIAGIQMRLALMCWRRLDPLPCSNTESAEGAQHGEISNGGPIVEQDNAYPKPQPETHRR